MTIVFVDPRRPLADCQAEQEVAKVWASYAHGTTNGIPYCTELVLDPRVFITSDGKSRCHRQLGHSGPHISGRIRSSYEDINIIARWTNP